MEAAVSEKKSVSRMVNPVIKKMAKRADAAAEGERTASYGGIGFKTVFFLLTTVAGIVLYFMLHQMWVVNGGFSPEETWTFTENIFNVTTTPYEMIALIVAAVCTLGLPLLAWAIRPIIPVVGILYTVSQGYLIRFLTGALEQDYKWLAVLAMVLTVALVSVMLFLYAKRIVKVNKRFKQIITTLFLTAIFGGVIMFVLQMIPGMKNIVQGIQGVTQNPIVSVGISIVFIVIAALFLLADFDTIESCVEERMPKKYEWMAAWGLAYTIIYLYFKILNLLIQIFSKDSSPT